MIAEEIPQTKDGLYAYISEAEKEIEKLKPSVSVFNKLKIRVKLCRERLSKAEGAK